GGRDGRDRRRDDDHRRHLRAAADLHLVLRNGAGGMMARSITAGPGLTTTAPRRRPPAGRPQGPRHNPPARLAGPVARALFFFPVLWMVIPSFKTEAQAYTTTPQFVFTPTLEQYKTVFASGIWPYFANSAFATIVSTIFVLLLATPCAFALSLRPVKKTRD